MNKLMRFLTILISFIAAVVLFIDRYKMDLTGYLKRTKLDFALGTVPPATPTPKPAPVSTPESHPSITPTPTPIYSQDSAEPTPTPNPFLPSPRLDPCKVDSMTDLSKGRPWIPPLEELNAQRLQIMAEFNSRYRIEEPVPNGKGIPENAFDELRKQVREGYGIHMEGSTIKGISVFCARKGENKEPGMPEAYEIINLFNSLVNAYRRANPQQADEIKEMFLDVCRLLIAQGWTDENFERGMTDRYRWKGVKTIFTMRKTLEEGGLLLPMARGCASWQNGVWFNEKAESNDSDFWHSYALNDICVSVAAMPDTPEKWQRMMAMMRYFNQSILCEGVLAKSGEFLHHGGTHWDYSYAMGITTDDILSLHQCGLDLSPEAHERLRAYGRTLAWVLLQKNYAPTMSLRAGGPCGNKTLTVELRKIANLGYKNAPIDREIAGYYLAMVEQMPDDDYHKKHPEVKQRYEAAGIQPAKMEGIIALSERPALIYRIGDAGDTIVNAVGMRANRRGYEIYGYCSHNACAYYSCNGSIQVMQNDGNENILGYDYRHGWDMRFWPATTSHVLDPKALFPRTNIGYGWSRSVIGGVCALGGASPVPGQLGTGQDAAGFAMFDLSGGPGGVNFHKTVFAIGGKLLVQTGAIQTKEQAPCVTTLFQTYLNNPNQPIVIDGRTATGVNYAETLSMSSTHTLTDAVGMQYIALPVPGQGTQPTLKVFRRHQSWRLPFPEYLLADNTGKKATGFNNKPPSLSLEESEKAMKDYTPLEGNWALAYFDHGSIPTHQGDAFVMVPAPRKPHTRELPVILLQNKDAHAALDPKTQTYAYASYAPNMQWDITGPVIKTGRPASMLVRLGGQHTMQLSLASWDDGNRESFAITLKGTWRLVAPVPGVKITTDFGSSCLEVEYSGQMPIFLEMN